MVGLGTVDVAYTFTDRKSMFASLILQHYLANGYAMSDAIIQAVSYAKDICRQLGPEGKE